MRKAIIGVVALAVGVAALLLGPPLARRGMKKCHEMMAEMQCGAAGERIKPVLRSTG